MSDQLTQPGKQPASLTVQRALGTPSQAPAQKPRVPPSVGIATQSWLGQSSFFSHGPPGGTPRPPSVGPASTKPPDPLPPVQLSATRTHVSAPAENADPSARDIPTGTMGPGAGGFVKGRLARPPWQRTPPWRDALSCSPMAVDELTSDAVTASFRLLQRRRGHRFSIDDLATAWEAVRAMPDATSFVDLGCGVGSVLLMVAWRLAEARGFGIEAQEISYELACRNVRDNGLDARVRVQHGDLRDVTRAWPHDAAPLVTGTPPYLPLGTASASPDPQRAAARIELRGGVEDYLAAGARVVAPEGVVVVCADARRPDRVLRGAAAAGLSPVRRVDVVPRAGRAALFSVWTCARGAGRALEHTAVTMRDADGERTAASREMRRTFGLD